VVKPPPDYGLPAVDVNKPVIDYPVSEPSVLHKDSPVAATSEIYSSSSGRRKKSTRRRVVDLSTPESSPGKPPSSVRFSPEAAIPAPPARNLTYGESPDPSPRTVPLYVPSEPRQAPSRESTLLLFLGSHQLRR
jgi:hypothetical protein